MNHNTIHQINWTFIFLMISSYVILSVLLLNNNNILIKEAKII